ncbi:DUF5753 domain-containing protein [Streptomyces sp. NBC_01335]|uniref:Scr1 family TA system antitoxin-like transcriptional regulator n=1 Tax=Streptomyces sp. NBC_01335 TaxID=2903828 RepID=UPI002E112F88|nr:DUF5753 domain-containing protein [Streptomyces sp. NBC_01335]WSI75223.1 DUF5753 domain-containing protein [Streptomyces sp. NBC_01335]
MRLTHLRKGAGLTGKELSARRGRHPAKATRIQKGAGLSSDADIRTWCAACGADDRAPDLIATARTADPDAMRGQLRHVLTVMPLASLSLGIIPFTAQRTVWPLEAFYVHDDTTAVVETLTAEIKVTQPRELAGYSRAFAGLAETAVYGDAARTLIQTVIDTLDE